MENEQTQAAPAATAPGDVVQPTMTQTDRVMGALAESKGPLGDANMTAAQNSPIHSAHLDLIKRQTNLHEKIALLAKRLEDVLATPFKGDQTAEARDSHGSSPVAINLATSSGITDNTTNVVDHLLSNLEI